VTDVGLKQLAGLGSLQLLDLVDTRISGIGLEHLKGLTNLRKLDIAHSRVTDAGLEHLKGLTGLQILFLADTGVTEGGVARLKESLPDCKILGVKSSKRPAEKPDAGQPRESGAI
jgi:hypothetical protein